MSIENTLASILAALERIADNTTPTVATPSPQAVAPDPPAPVAVPPAPAVTAAAPPAPVAVPPAPVAYTPEQMNDHLMAEFKRIGSKEPIQAALAAMGFTGVTDCPAEKQQELLAAVRAIQP